MPSLNDIIQATLKEICQNHCSPVRGFGRTMSSIDLQHNVNLMKPVAVRIFSGVNLQPIKVENLGLIKLDNLFIFPFDRSQLDFLKKNGFTNFSKLMAKPDPSELEVKILSSLHWYGLAIKDEQNVDKFVKLVIALESLLLDKDDPSKKILLADRAAFLLGKDLKQRQEIYNSVAKAYSLRGEIVHEGRYELSIKEIIELREILRHLIIKLTRMTNKVSTLKEIKFNSKAII
jgi:hypothetical protein